MSDKEEKFYCVIDHANKQRDRDRAHRKRRTPFRADAFETATDATDVTAPMGDETTET